MKNLERPFRADAIHSAAPFALAGTLCVIGGGLLAAITAHAPTEHATWAVAYLVLVCGVAQVVIGAGQAVLHARIHGSGSRLAELLLWNLGNAGVIAGTVADRLWLTVAGSVLLAASLVLFLRASRGAARSMMVSVYRIVLLVVLVSIPIGIVVAIAKG